MLRRVEIKIIGLVRHQYYVTFKVMQLHSL